MRGGRIMIADRFYSSTQICSCYGCLTGPKGRENMHVELDLQWMAAHNTSVMRTPQSICEGRSG
jgi:hypothetical protein